MSDLQCPARLYVGWPTSAADVARWGDALRTENVPTTVDQRGAVADLATVADAYRGEGVLVLVDRRVDELPTLGEGELLACEVDADGVRLVPSPFRSV